MTIQEAIATVCAKHDLHSEEMIAVMRSIMTGEATDAQIGALLMGLRMKGETIDEIVGAASVMRELSQKVDVPANFWLIPVERAEMAQIFLMYQQHPHLWSPLPVGELRSTVTVLFLRSQDQQMFLRLRVFA